VNPIVIGAKIAAGRRRQLAQGVLRADVDDAGVLRLLGAGHDAGPGAELLAHFEHDPPRGPPHGADRQRA